MPFPGQRMNYAHGSIVGKYRKMGKIKTPLILPHRHTYRQYSGVCFLSFFISIQKYKHIHIKMWLYSL